MEHTTHESTTTMKEYFVIEANSLAQLETEVRNRMDQGWQVCGSLAVVNNTMTSSFTAEKQGYNLLFFQPITKVA